MPEYPLLAEAGLLIVYANLKGPKGSRLIRASGKEYIPLVVIPKLKLFESVMSRVPVACHELPPESPVDGLLGLDLLTRLSAIIDLTKPSIRVH